MGRIFMCSSNGVYCSHASKGSRENRPGVRKGPGLNMGSMGSNPMGTGQSGAEVG